MDDFFHDLPEHKREILREIETYLQGFASKDTDFSGPELLPQEYKGFRFPPGQYPEAVQKFFQLMTIEENTVFLASFPRTGTNWMQEIMRQILYGHDERFDFISKNMLPLIWIIEFGKSNKLDLYEHIPLPRKFLRTHVHADLVDFEKMKRSNSKIIVPIRNPKDQLVSWFHFTQYPQFDSQRDVYSSDWSKYLTDCTQGKHPIFTKPGEWYLDYLLGWYKYNNEDNVRFVHFEDMKKDPEFNIKEIADFLGVEITDDRVSQIAKASSFDAMEKDQVEAKSESAKMRAAMKIIRKGQVGAWKEKFTVAQSDMVDKLVEEKLGHTDIKFRYE